MKVGRRHTRHTWWIRAFFVLVALPLLGVSPFIGVVNNPNENVRTYMTMALVDDHTFRLDEVIKRFGWVNDMAKVPGKNGEPDYHSSVKGPAVSYAGVPIYWAFKKVAVRLGHTAPSKSWTLAERIWWMRSLTFTLRFFVVQIPCFLFLVWFERYLRTVTSDVSLRLSAVAAAGLGTNFLAYSQAYVSHSLFAVAAFLAFALAEMDLRLLPRQRSVMRAFWAGVFCGLATLLEYHALPVSVILAAWGLSAFYRPTRFVAFAFGGMLNAGAMMFFQWRAFGSPFTPGHKMMETAIFSAQTHKGIFGLTMPAWEPFKLLSVDTSFGFFGTSPYMWLGLLAIPFALFSTFGPPRERRVRRFGTLVWMSAMLLIWLILSGAVMWRGGWTVGPRYLGAAPPFFAYGAVCALERVSRTGAVARGISRGLAGGLALASVMSIGFVGLVYNTLPPSLLHPLTQFALPLARAGFVAHHAMEWVGWTSPTFWYIAAVALAAAPTAAALARSKLPDMAYGLQITFAVLAIWVGLLPQFVKKKPKDPPNFDLRPFVAMWEPPGRDRLTSLRAEAESYGPRRPCLWHRLADLEASVTLTTEAASDRERAGAPRADCPRGFLGL
jgi:hypothetical protein